MNLKMLSNTELENNLIGLVTRESELLHEILLHIQEVDSRRLYLEKGRSSLFEYLTTDLGYSGSSAQRRIEGARLIREVPAVAEMIKERSLHLCQVGTLVRAIKQKENESQVRVTSEEKLELIRNIECRTGVETQKILAQELDLDLKPFEAKTVQKDESVSVLLTFTKEQFERIEACKNLLSHRLLKESGLELANVLDLLAQDFLKAQAPKNAKAKKRSPTAKVVVIPKVVRILDNIMTNNPFPQSIAKPTTGVIFTAAVAVKPNRFVNTKCRPPESKFATSESQFAKSETGNKTLTAKTRKEIRQHYRCCQYRSPVTRNLCGSRFLLEVDHIQPRWAGGTNKIENLNLLCSAHNKAKYRREARLI